MIAEWRVRRAAEADAEAIAAVATAGWRDTYQGLLRPETIEAFIDHAYSPERVRARIAAHEVYVAEDDGRVGAFADVVEQAGSISMQAIYAAPDVRGRGAGTALLRAVIDRFPGRAIWADVLFGNRKGEAFYERRGFVARERIEGSLFGEAVAERRWWRDPERDRVAH